MTRSSIYQPSGKTSATGQGLFILISLLLIPFLGYGYTILSFHVPLIYVNVLITIGAAILLGVYNLLLTKYLHNRSKKNLMIGTVITVLIFYISSWFTFLGVGLLGTYSYFDHFSIILELINDYGVFYLIGNIFKYGIHTIMGTPLSGWSLLFVWVIEAGILFFIPLMMVYKHVLFPYSEQKMKPYKSEKIDRQFSRVASEKILIENLDSDFKGTIESLDLGNVKGHSILAIHTLPEESDHYISVSNVFYDSKNRKSTDLVLRYYRINNDQLEFLKKQFKTKKVMFSW